MDRLLLKVRFRLLTFRQNKRCLLQRPHNNVPKVRLSILGVFRILKRRPKRLHNFELRKRLPRQDHQKDVLIRAFQELPKHKQQMHPNPTRQAFLTFRLIRAPVFTKVEEDQIRNYFPTSKQIHLIKVQRQHRVVY